MEFLVAITGIGCGTAIVLTFIDKVFGGGKEKQKAQIMLLQGQNQAAEERARQLELQLADERRHNEQLQKQVEWHGKLLETQDKMLNRLSGPSTNGERSLPEQAVVR
jgi:hypothetical protein